MRRDSVNSASGRKTAVNIVFNNHAFILGDIFPLLDDVCGIYVMFYAEFSSDLVTSTFDLLTVTVSD